MDDVVPGTHYERESTLRVPIEKQLFLNVYDTLNAFKSGGGGGGDDNNGRQRCLCDKSIDRKLFKCFSCLDSGIEYTESVTLYGGDDFRLAGRSFERKTTETQERVAAFHDGKLYPIVRTCSTEQRLPLPRSVNEIGPITKTLYRVSLCRTYADGTDGNATPPPIICRLSYNAEEDCDGVFYHLACEVEYATDASYDACVSYERLMFTEFFDYFKHLPVPMDDQSLNDLFACVAPKVQMWSCFDPQEDYLWAYKWNGVKAKFMINSENRVLLWPDTADQKLLYISGDPTPIKHINFQAEIMPDSIVLVHAISVSFFGKIYTIEPYTSIAILNFIRERLARCVIYDSNADQDYRLIVQRFFPKPKPESFDTTRYDGFILAQKTLFIKWKTPTIDARYAGDGVFEIGQCAGDKIVKFTLDADQAALVSAECKVGKIYELSSKLALLRERNDRLMCSTLNEYYVFIKNVQLLNNK